MRVLKKRFVFVICKTPVLIIEKIKKSCTIIPSKWRIANKITTATTTTNKIIINQPAKIISSVSIRTVEPPKKATNHSLKYFYLS